MSMKMAINQSRQKEPAAAVYRLARDGRLAGGDFTDKIVIDDNITILGEIAAFSVEDGRFLIFSSARCNLLILLLAPGGSRKRSRFGFEAGRLGKRGEHVAPGEISVDVLVGKYRVDGADHETGMNIGGRLQSDW